MIKACIFDLDGTLLDSLDDLTDSINEALTDHGYSTHRREVIASYMGNGMGKLVERSLPKNASELEKEDVLHTFKDIYNLKKDDKTCPYPGILDLLETLQLSGIRCAILSNKTDQAVKELAEKYFPGVFVEAIGQREGIPLKPHPQSLTSLINHLGLEKDEVVYLGDTEVDMETAQLAGVRALAVLWGFRSKEALEKAGAKGFLTVPTDLLEELFQ